MKSFARLKIIFYLHDLIPVDFPEYVGEQDDVKHINRVKTMIEYGDEIWVNSNYTKERLALFCRNNSLDCLPVKILHIGTEDIFFQSRIQTTSSWVLDELKNKKFFVYISTIEPRKNHLMLINLWKQYFLDDENAPTLVLIGKRGWNNQVVFDALDKSHGLKSKVIELSNLDDAAMVSIVSMSQAVLFPSFVEGWGMPAVEALSQGKIVVCSDTPALKESTQELAIYLDPLDTISWRDTIIRILDDYDFSSQCLQKIQGFVPPSWENTFKEVDLLLAEKKVFKNDIPLESEVLASNFLKSLLVIKDNESEVKYSSRKQLSPRRRKLRKLVRNPVLFFMESKNPLLNTIGRKMQEI